MTKILLLVDEKDSDASKLKWFSSELEKRDLDLLAPELDSSDYESWRKDFSNIKMEITPGTIIVAKGAPAMNILKELEKGTYGVKGLFIITDQNVKEDILEHDFETIKKKVINFFIYAFQKNENFPMTEANILADKVEAELFVLEGAEDNSDYEDILADVLSLEPTV